MSKYRCLGCRQYQPRPAYRSVGLGAVCSSECLTETAHRSRRRAVERVVVDEIPAATRERVSHRDSGRCRYCGGRSNLHFHHITYRSQGVDHSEHNLITLCGRHHDLIHSDKRRWQPICRAYIWYVYVLRRSRFLLEVERDVTDDGQSLQSHRRASDR